MNTLPELFEKLSKVNSYISLERTWLRTYPIADDNRIVWKCRCAAPQIFEAVGDTAEEAIQGALQIYESKRSIVTSNTPSMCFNTSKDHWSAKWRDGVRPLVITPEGDVYLASDLSVACARFLTDTAAEEVLLAVGYAVTYDDADRRIAS